MILAAGLGTRLGDITRDTPKALVDVGGRPILEHVARRLIDAGATRLIINVHHHADAIVEFVHERSAFGVAVVFSHEEEAPLETGGGLLHAAPLFSRDAPFLLHNVDVICDTDLRALYEAHTASDALATLAIHERATSRFLLFDDIGLCGRCHTRDDRRVEVRVPQGEVKQRAFAGIHVISPQLLDMFEESGAFSIMDTYMRLAGAGSVIAGHDIGDATWLEIGNPERLEAARRWVEAH